MTQSEKDIFFEIVVHHKDVIFNKKTDANSACSKKQTWDLIAQEFNALGLTRRTSEQLKTCFKNSSAQLKKDLAADKAESFKTGGGSSTQRVDENHILLPMILPSVTPLPNPYDSSSEYFSEDIVDMNSGIDISTIDFDDSVIIEDVENSDVAGSSTTISGVIPARPKLGNRKRNNNIMLKEFVDQQGELKRTQLECDIEAKKNKSEMYLELKNYYSLKRRILESQNSQNSVSEDAI